MSQKQRNMNRANILREILRDETLREYWRDLSDINQISEVTIKRKAEENNNFYLKYLGVLFDATTDNNSTKFRSSLRNILDRL